MAEKGGVPTHKRLFLACVPRCVSTSLTKCLSAVDEDHEVWFEPYISCNYALIEYEVRMGKKLELEYEGNEGEYEKAAVFIENQGVDINDVNDLSHLKPPSGEPKLMSVDLRRWYMSCRHALIEYELRTGKELELDYEGNESEYEKAAVFMENQGVDLDDVNVSNLPSSSNDPKLMSYPEIKKCLETASSRLVIVKDFGIAVDGFYEYLPSVEAGYKYIFLIRDPLLTSMSYRRSVVAFDKKNHGLVDDSKFDLSDDKFYPGGGEAFRRQHKFWRYVCANIDPNPLIIDSEDLLAQPAACVRKICEVIGVEYRDSLLRWNAATKSEVWMNYANTSMGQLMTSGFLSDFHAGAMKGTGFSPSTKRKPDESEITPDVHRIVKRGMKYYKEMYENRFIPDLINFERK